MVLAQPDIRFVMVEVGKLTANVDRLISDIGSQGTKLDAIQHQVSFVKGAIWASAAAFVIIIGVVSFFLHAKWEAVTTALDVLQKTTH